MDDDQQFCLRWNNHQSTLISVFDTLLENETLVDCTLAAEGKFLKAHKVVLSACSPYFATLLQEQYDKHPIFILKDVKYQELRAMMDYMYRGEVNISQDQLAALLKAAESLQIKGLSDNRSGGNSGASGNTAAAAQAAAQQATKSDAHHRVKLSGTYTLEQTKRSRGAMDVSGDVSGSREGSSSPSRRRRKVRRRSMENDVHDNSNSSVLQAVAAASNQSILQQTSASLAASALVSTQLASGSSVGAAAAATNASGSSSIQVSTQPLTSSSSNVTKKTESAKLTSTAAQGAQQQQQQQQTTTSDAINTDNVQQQQQQQQNESTQGEADEMDVASGGAGVASGAVAVHPGVVKQLATLDKSNHKQKIKDNSITTTATTEMVIEPKAEYDEDAHDENVEDLTLDEEDMTMEELDQAAGTSQGGDGSSQAYATWQHDRSQDELGLMAAQDAQQRDPQDDNGQLDAGESRIRVRNWLMLADQSIIDKTSDDSTDKLTPSKKTNTNAAKNTTNNVKTPAGATPTTMTISTTPASVTRALNSSSNHNNSSNSNNNTSSNNNNVNSEKSCLPVTQTVTRIGCIGRTTIACITPASLKNSSSNCNVDAASAAALAAAGVELDSIDDAMTEVIVKIENPENVSLNGDEAVCNEAIDDENTFDYDLKLASPLSWTYDAVKIENEEFEDSYLMDNDDDDDDLLTTAAASQKHAKQSKSNNNGNANNNNSGSKIVLSSQQQQQLLDQQQHLQHLQLQPTSQSSLQIKLPTIPATITTIAAPTSKQQPIASTSGGANANSSSGGNSTVLSSNKMALNVDAQNLNLHWSHTDDNRYRILVQNKRMRKESLEHSADMIYNADIEKPWVCRNCNRTYKWKNSLKCHLKNECGLPPRYFCSKMCGYATNVHSNLKRHLNTKCRDREKEEEEKEKEKEKEKKYNVTAVPATTTTSVNVNTSSSGSSSNGNTSTYTLVFPNK